MAGTLALSWLALIAALALCKPAGVDFREAKRFVPDLVRLVRDLSRDPNVGRGVRVRLWLLLAYLALPLDLVPDFIPVLGYADDLIVTAIALRSVVRVAGADALERHWSGSPRGLELLRQLAAG